MRTDTIDPVIALYMKQAARLTWREVGAYLAICAYRPVPFAALSVYNSVRRQFGPRLPWLAS